MNTYARNSGKNTKAAAAAPKQSGHTSSQAGQSGEGGMRPSESGMRVDGFQQIIDMLEAADPKFRETLLRQISAKDPSLAQKLRMKLAT